MRGARTRTVGASLVEVLVAATVVVTLATTLAAGSLQSLRLGIRTDAIRVRERMATDWTMQPLLDPTALPACPADGPPVPCVRSSARCTIESEAIDCLGRGPLVRVDVQVPTGVLWSSVVTLWRWDP